MKKRISLVLAIFCLLLSFAGCSSTAETEVTITVAAASSLKNCMDEKLIPAFNSKYPDVKVQTTYDGSGKLQAQIEQGASVDVFMPAAMNQMTALDKKGLLLEDSAVQLLENKIVLIVPSNSTKGITTFEDIVKADKVAIGDPSSVPAGQYAEEALKNLALWEQVSAKASLGTNVTEVLNWVAEGSADAGIVYKTDAASDSRIKIVAEAPEGSVSKVIYPAGVIKVTENMETAKTFVEFLQTDEAMEIFKAYGFTANR